MSPPATAGCFTVFDEDGLREALAALQKGDMVRAVGFVPWADQGFSVQVPDEPVFMELTSAGLRSWNLKPPPFGVSRRWEDGAGADWGPRP
jgi:hypothetical protein